MQVGSEVRPFISWLTTEEKIRMYPLGLPIQSSIEGPYSSALVDVAHSLSTIDILRSDLNIGLNFDSQDTMSLHTQKIGELPTTLLPTLQTALEDRNLVIRCDGSTVQDGQDVQDLQEVEGVREVQEVQDVMIKSIKRIMVEVSKPSRERSE